MKETLARKPHDFEKLRSPTNAASDWRGAGTGSVDCLALETSIKPGMFCLRASQIWFHLICGRRLPRGGHLGIFKVGMCRPGLQIGTPF